MQSLLLLGSILSSTYAQTAGVTCLSTFNWMLNQRGQNPCIVAAYLQVSCGNPGGSWNIPPLPAGQSYTGPAADGANVCTCSGLVYNLLSACAACQGRTSWLSWSGYKANCPASITSVSQWPSERIPVATSIEAWAYLDPTRSDTFNLTQSLALTDNPESTFISRATTGPSTSRTATSLITASASNTNAPTPQPTKNSNAGARLGGIIGGVLALAAIIGGIIFYRQRQKSYTPVASIDPYGTPTPLRYSDTFTSSHLVSSNSLTTPKLYDPDDPSTFPPSTNQASAHSIPNPGFNLAMTSTPLALATSSPDGGMARV